MVLARFLSSILPLLVFMSVASAQTMEQINDKFRQLNEYLPTPNVYRNAAGAPGHEYWQQQADYKIDVTLDDEKQRLSADATIKYYNNSPDSLRYLWVQLDQNQFAKGSLSQGRKTAGVAKTKGEAKDKKISYRAYQLYQHERKFKGGHDILAVKDSGGADLPYTIVETMMRIDLASPLRPGENMEFSISWAYNIVDLKVYFARSGYEYFEDDGNYVYQMAQWFPRMAAYTDYEGWNNKQFFNHGEFTLEFGDYDVSITVPADHVVASTGVLQNPNQVLTDEQQDRLKKARKSDKPVLIVSPEEALENQKSRAKTTKTWRFKAENVRDFAFASSRKFIWDAMGVYQPENDLTVMAMSFYPDEANPLWGQYSTHAVAHTMRVYNKYALIYPYPVTNSVHGKIGGMEYPMMTFNGYRPTTHDDGTKTYDRRTKYGLISVIIHEVGHIYFPMIVNSDERQWSWMDEGLNTFLQFLTEQEWEENYPSRRGEPYNIINYMKSSNQVPIMTNSESILQFGNNAYGKPATALNILRETVIGRELFDFAFREYSRRWQYKRPTPADFFRTMEDATAVDLDWFWRGWFYTTDNVDISLDDVRLYRLDTKNPEIEEVLKRKKDKDRPHTLTEQRNEGMERYIDSRKELKDFYNENDKFTVTNKQRNTYTSLLDGLEDWEKDLLNDESLIYVMDFTNKGGLVMPIILDVTYEDDSREEIRLPAEIWVKNTKHVNKLIITEKKIKSVTVDPHLETADVNTFNNHFPRKIEESRLELFKRKKARDLMKEIKTPLKDDEEDKKSKK